MSELKVHLFDPKPEDGMPAHMVYSYLDKGLRGTLCGYIRKYTYVASEVTCKNCLRILKNTP